MRGKHLLERHRGRSRRERSVRGSSLDGGSPDGGSLFDRVVPQVRNSSAGCESTCETIVAQSALRFHGVRLLRTYGSDFTMADLKTRSGIDSLLDEQGSGDHTLRMCETNACAPYGLRHAFSFVKTVNIFQYPRRLGSNFILPSIRTKYSGVPHWGGCDFWQNSAPKALTPKVKSPLAGNSR